MTHDPRAILAASNNADLYEAIFAAWGVRYERLPFAFVSGDMPPPYHSHLTVLAPSRVSDVLAQLRTLAHRCDGVLSVKDSFCELDLRAHGFQLLFEADWVWRAADRAGSAKGWAKVETGLELERWEAAWKRSGPPTEARMFRNAMLRSRHVVFLGKLERGDFVAGCIANLSSACVGISNLFSISREGRAFDDATAAVASLNPRLPIVGYCAGARLEAAGRAGYERTGGLRVWEARHGRFQRSSRTRVLDRCAADARSSADAARIGRQERRDMSPPPMADIRFASARVGT